MALSARRKTESSGWSANAAAGSVPMPLRASDNTANAEGPRQAPAGQLASWLPSSTKLCSPAKPSKASGSTALTAPSVIASAGAERPLNALADNVVSLALSLSRSSSSFGMPRNAPADHPASSVVWRTKLSSESRPSNAPGSMALTAMLSNSSVRMPDRPWKAPVGNVVKREVWLASKVRNAASPWKAPGSIVSMPARERSKTSRADSPRKASVSIVRHASLPASERPQSDDRPRKAPGRTVCKSTASSRSVSSVGSFSNAPSGISPIGFALKFSACRLLSR